MKQKPPPPEQVDRSKKEKEQPSAPRVERRTKRAVRERSDLYIEDQEVTEKTRQLREAITSRREQDTTGATARLFLRGAFQGEPMVDGRLRLEESAKKAMEQGAAEFRGQASYMTNIMSGKQIATEYGSHAHNFSTQTCIHELPDGRKTFIVFNHAGSWLHRWLDTTMKWASGLKMRKAKHGEWKTWFEEKSNIPVIENGDPNTVVMPFIPNVNALDAFVHDKEIGDFGECEWAEHLEPQDKLELAHRIMDEIRRLHGQGAVWGEAILPNIIFTKDKQPVICDPEIRFDPEMPLKEAMARDLRDLCLSIASALETVAEMDVGDVVESLLDRYGDREVIIELQDLAHRKSGLLQRLTKGYELVRSGAGTSQRYEAILHAIREYNTDRLLRKRR